MKDVIVDVAAMFWRGAGWYGSLTMAASSAFTISMVRPNDYDVALFAGLSTFLLFALAVTRGIADWRSDLIAKQDAIIKEILGTKS